MARQRAGRQRWLVPSALVGVAVVWGVSFVVVKDATITMPTTEVVGWRFGIAAIVLAMIRPRSLLATSATTLKCGLVLGTLLGSGFLLCTQGMRTTSVVATAFIVGTTVVFAPLFSWAWFRRTPTTRTALAISLAVTGLALLTLRGTAVGLGSLMILGAAALWALHLCALERWVQPDQAHHSALVQVSTAALVALLVGRMTGTTVQLPDLTEGGSVLYLGAVATAAAFLALTWAQSRIDATTAAVLLTLEPVVGGAAAVALGEPLTLVAVVGAAAVLGASVLVISRPPMGDQEKPLRSVPGAI
ncbi:MAG: DMT family transporter [Microlunatus sp.]|nr:DMT family transporter [Microlunatus sp.]